MSTFPSEWVSSRAGGALEEAGGPAAAPRGPLSIRNAPVTILSVLGLIAILKLARPFLVPLAFAVMISYALEPLVRFMTRHHLPRALATALLTLTLFGLGGAAGYALLDNALEAVDSLPGVAQKLRRALRDSRADGSPIEKVEQAASEMTKSSTDRGVTRVQIEEPPVGPLDYFRWSGTLLSLLALAATVFVLVFFLLVSGDLFRRKMVSIVGPGFARKKVTLRVLREIDAQIGRFLLVQLFISTSVAVTTSIVLAWFGLDQPVVWGIVAGIFTPVPYFGPIAVSLGVGLVAFLQLGSLPTALYITLALGSIATLKGFVIAPWLAGRATRMNQISVVIGLLFWTWLWGISGMLLAVPLMTTLKAVCDHVPSLRPVGEMLGE